MSLSGSGGSTTAVNRADIPMDDHADILMDSHADIRADMGALPNQWIEAGYS